MVIIKIAGKTIKETDNVELEIEKYIKAKEDLKKVMENCIEKEQSVIAHFETEIKRASEGGEIGAWSYKILRENKEEILNYYRACLGLKVVLRYRTKEEIKKEIECAICLGKHRQGEMQGIEECAHEFGQVCLAEWLKVKKQCPLCRSSAQELYSYREME